MNPTGGPKTGVNMTELPPSGMRHLTRNWTETGSVDFDGIEWKALFYCSSLKEFTTIMYGALPSLFSIFLLCNFIPGFSMSMAVFVSGIHCAVLVLVGLLSRRLSKGSVFDFFFARLFFHLHFSLSPFYSNPWLEYLLIRGNVWLYFRCQAPCTGCGGDLK